MISSPARPAVQSAAERYPEASKSSCREVSGLADQMAAFLEGEDVTFALDLLALGDCGAFREKVLRATHAIGRGYVATYGGLAAHVGCRGGARAVGNAMATNPFPLIIPCHRVIRADRTLGSYGGGGEMKRLLLAQEGIHEDAMGRATQSQLVFGS
ncbi:MAG: MGMT family protein [Kiritimatiellia bacterium]|nr:MGMT family protein [Kiritimatiellia bacterium]MDP6630070.1 MGMT family protein [Kiritimatiellia bacterium]MDP7023793.1 MGMT family protein [Kiritimatiellia bacterium]